MEPLGPLRLVHGQQEGEGRSGSSAFPSPLLALLHDDKEVSAILATVLGSLHDSGNSDNVPAKPPGESS